MEFEARKRYVSVVERLQGVSVTTNSDSSCVQAGHQLSQTRQRLSEITNGICLLSSSSCMWNNFLGRRPLGGVMLRSDSNPRMRLGIRGFKGCLPPVILSGVSGTTGLLPSSVGLGVDKRGLHVPRTARGSNIIRVRTSRTSSVAVRYPKTQSNVCGVGCAVASVGKPYIDTETARTISTVTSMHRRACPRSRRLLHQTTTPTPTTAASGKHVWGIPSASSKDGASSVTKASIFNNRTDHGTDIVDESIRRSRVGNEGTRGGHKLEPPPKVAQEVL